VESSHLKHFNNFLTANERSEIIEYVNTINHKSQAENVHLSHLIKKINGNSHMYDISKTDSTKNITSFQSGGNDVMKEELPDIFHNLIDRITATVNIPKENMFLQIVDMDEGGTIGGHYDAAIDGYINYKCNISVLSDDYIFVVDGEELTIKENDLYCFEASLYKHWTLNPFHSRRILLSFGFILPYSVLGRNENDPRVRLSKRIEKIFQKDK
jgi:hypothetical protein